MEKAIFAAGCFWGVEEAFRTLNGVTETRVGYTGGTTAKPSYEQVCSGKTGHAESVEVTFDPQKISFEKLLDVFWGIHNPTTMNRQGPDVGAQYRSAIFYLNEKQKEEALKSKEKMEKSGKYSSPIATEITPAKEFFEAEEYHQKYFLKTGRKACHF
ncbi:MAG: peptide-methionine (S)-S-oxide reductase MsrA [Candidatus Diapherotrites archaeon]